MVASSSGSMVTSGRVDVGAGVPTSSAKETTGTGASGRRRHLGAVLVGDHHRPQVGELGQVRRQALEARRVDEGDLGARVGQSVVELGARPPRVERHDHAAGHGRAPERHGPLGEVAHGDGDPVAELDAEAAAQPTGDGGRDAEVLLVGGALVLVDEIVGVAVPAGQLEDHAQVGRAVLPHPGGDAPDLDVFHLEHLPRRGDGPRSPPRSTWRGCRASVESPCGRRRAQRAPARVARGRRRRQASATGGGVHPASEGSTVVPGSDDGVDPVQDLVGQGDLERPQGAGHLLHGAGADDGRGHGGMGEHEGQGQVGEGHTGIGRHLDEGLDHLELGGHLGTRRREPVGHAAGPAARRAGGRPCGSGP